MLLAVWRRGGQSAPRDTSATGATALAIGGTRVWVTRPSRASAAADEVRAWVNGLGDDSSAGTYASPFVHATEQSLTFTAGTVPQYPLYYSCARDNSVVAICSDLAPLADSFGDRGLDLERIVGLLAWQLGSSPDRTVFRGIRRLRACETVHVDDDGIRASMEGLSAPDSFLDAPAEHLACELRSRLEAAIARAVGTQRRIALYAGGGLDSSGLVALTIAKYRGATDRELRVLAETWQGPGDDRPYLDALERDLGFTAVRIRAENAAPWFVQSLSCDRQPQLFGHGCAELLLWASAVAEKADVAIGGHGGDALAGGEVTFLSRVARGRPIRAVREALALEVPWHANLGTRLGWVVSPIAGCLIPERMLIERRRRRVRKPWMTRLFMELLEPHLVSRSALSLTPRERLKDLCTNPIWTELTVAWGQYAAATGATTVDVFRDPDLVRFVAQIDPATLTAGGVYRGLQRLALKGLVPESIRLRRQKAFVEPFVAAAALTADATGLLADLASCEQLASLGLVDPDAFRTRFSPWLRALRRGERSDPDPTDGAGWQEIWPALALERFLRQENATRGHGPRRRGEWPWVLNDGTFRDDPKEA